MSAMLCAALYPNVVQVSVLNTFFPQVISIMLCAFSCEMCLCVW